MIHRLTRSTKVYINREGETTTLKRWNVGGVMIRRSCSFNQRAVVRSFREVCVMLDAAGIADDVLLSRSRG